MPDLELRHPTNKINIVGYLQENQIFNPLLEVVNNSLQSPVANHTLKRTFGPCVEALCGPEIRFYNSSVIEVAAYSRVLIGYLFSRHMPPPLKMHKAEEANPDIPDILQGEIARLDSRFKVIMSNLTTFLGCV